MAGRLGPLRKGAGQRRQRITLWSSSSAVDGLLSQTEGQFSQFGQAWAAMDEVLWVKDASEHGKTYEVTIKYRSDVVAEFETSKKRVQVRGAGVTLNLLEIENPERRNRDLVLHCAVA
jgi:head-tail adaptor